MGLHSSKQKKKEETKVTDHDRALLKMKNSRDRLTKYQRHLDTVIAKEVEVARQLVKDGRKDRALLVLRKKRYQEDMLKKADAQLTNIMQMINDVEWAQQQNQYLDAMKEGTATLKSLQNEWSVEDVEKLMDDTAEAVAITNEVGELLGEALDADAALAAEEELEELERAALAAEVDKQDVPSKPMPDVPVAEPAAAADDAEPERKMVAA
eukprot:TRINITY_DN13226_c0_g1_i1.p1 TRINITY_DN13226_c0_g1~~TRINITY_DN13226_c0_g1_i1.p1  ORF type:complete len:210 (+),score=110.04 TRINITY_DN13226_c0_g1_i1:51-680(+)